MHQLLVAHFKGEHSNRHTVVNSHTLKAKLEDGKASVSLQEFDSDHSFYKLEGSNNIVLLTTERYRKYPMLIQGYGAGASVTAAGVFADIMSLA